MLRLAIDDIQFGFVIRKSAMENEETISEIHTEASGRQPKTSKLAIMSMVFGMLGPLSFAPILMLSLYGLSFYDLVVVSPPLTTFFACGVAWILGLALGMKSLRQIEDSRGQLAGTSYAIAGITISAAWMLSIVAGLLLPALFYVNS